MLIIEFYSISLFPFLFLEKVLESPGFSSFFFLLSINLSSEVYTENLPRGRTRVPPTSRGAPCPPPSSRGGILSLRVRERIPGIPVPSQEDALSTGKARGTPGSCHHYLSPPDVSVHSRETCFPCTASTFKPRIDSHHGGTLDSPVGKRGGKASWETLEGKPQIP